MFATSAEYAAGPLSHPAVRPDLPCRLGQTRRERSPIQKAIAADASATTHALPPSSADQTATSPSESAITANSVARA